MQDSCRPWLSKTKIKTCKDETKTDIHDYGLPPEKNVMPSPYINTYSVFKSSKIYYSPQIHVEECKYKVKEEALKRLLLQILFFLILIMIFIQIVILIPVLNISIWKNITAANVAELAPLKKRNDELMPLRKRN